MREALKPKFRQKSGILFVKENFVLREHNRMEIIYGKTRTVASFKRIFEEAGFEILCSERDEFC